jgi:hypothetical protein
MTFHFILKFNGVPSDLQITLSTSSFSLYLKTLQKVYVYN